LDSQIYISELVFCSMGFTMKKAQVIGVILLSTIFGSIFFAGFASAIDPYFPDPEDVEGYDLLWESIITVSNPWNDTAPDIEAGGQIWTKNDTANDVSAVVGVAIIKFSEDVFGEQIPSLIRQILTLDPKYNNVKTYWDLLVAVVTESAGIADISDIIKTTDGSIEFNTGGGTYLILSKDAEFMIFTFAFEVSNDWINYVAGTVEDVTQVFEDYIVFVAGILAAFQLIIEIIGGFDGTIPTPESSSPSGELAPPTGDPTSAADVQYVTIQIGSLYGSSNLLWIILGIAGAVVIVGSLFFIFRRKRK
jgi:hypothetical protein